jgi:transposase-like protein
MNCPRCNFPRLTNGGTNASGTQRYQCLECGCKFTPSPRKAGRKPLGKVAMSSTERSRKRRERLKRVK